MEAKELKLGPVVYRLVFDNAAAFAFEEEYRRRFGRERGIFQFLTECAFTFQDAQAVRPGESPRGPSLTELSVAFWALANTHHVKPRGRDALTVEKIQKEMDPMDYFSYVGLAMVVAAEAMPKDKEAEERKGGEGGAPLAGT